MHQHLQGQSVSSFRLSKTPTDNQGNCRAKAPVSSSVFHKVLVCLQLNM